MWLVTLLAIRAVVDLQRIAGVHEIILALVPVLFMYTPVWMCRWRGVDSWDYPLALPAFRDAAPWKQAVAINAAFIAVITLPWLVGYHYWQTLVFGHHFQGTWPGTGPCRFDGGCSELLWLGYAAAGLAKLIGYHLFFVAIPEEFFYRGYVQSRLDEAFGRRWNVFGAWLGPGWLLGSLIFAFGHSIVQLQWWHFAIFFPSLVFGWMRARTGQIVANAGFHAWCNVMVSTLDTLYGIVPA